jgi:endonuclease-3 related protein
MEGTAAETMKPSEIYDTLYARYGDPHWWPGDTPYEIMTGAVLTQNCAWSNVEKAIANFGGGLTPDFVLNAETAELIEIIRPAGFFNQKAAYLKAVTAWFGKYGFDVATVQREPLEKLRTELLATKGVGRETADSILLYAFDLPTFVVDAYTARLCERLPLPAGKGYEEIKAYFEANLTHNAEVYNNIHALIVINAKEYCRKKPKCDGCPLEDICGRRGL